MKLKAGFRRFLLLIRKRFTSTYIRSHFANDPELYYAVALVITWLMVFIIVHLKFLNDFK
jgi:hypothetical protein